VCGERDGAVFAGVFVIRSHLASTLNPYTSSANIVCMNTQIDHLLDQALLLPIAERSAVVVALLDSIDGSDEASISEAWQAEIKRRRLGLREGSITVVPWSEAKKRINAR
jgi:putative addiction module component (TIGR02574 family)